MKNLVTLIFFSCILMISCKEKEPKEDDKPKECHSAIVFTSAVPISIKYAEVDTTQTCPPPGIGDVSTALKRKVAELCGLGECEKDSCKPESTLVTINRQHTSYSRIVGDRRECWVVIEAEVNTRCVCLE